MAVERRRGCGYRKIGGTYLVSEGITVQCDRLPIQLDVCPTCSSGFKQARGWQWVSLIGLVGGPHIVRKFVVLGNECDCWASCPLCKHPASIGKAGLLWIGEMFYKTPGAFMAEGREMGFSRRITAIPRGFEVGTTWVMLAHSKTVETYEAVAPAVNINSGTQTELLPVPHVEHRLVRKPGIFTLWKPTKIEKLFG